MLFFLLYILLFTDKKKIKYQLPNVTFKFCTKNTYIKASFLFLFFLFLFLVCHVYETYENLSKTEFWIFLFSMAKFRNKKIPCILLL